MGCKHSSAASEATFSQGRPDSGFTSLSEGSPMKKARSLHINTELTPVTNGRTPRRKSGKQTPGSANLGAMCGKCGAAGDHQLNPEAPPVEPFAVMRQVHECIRATLIQIQDMISARDYATAYGLWVDLLRAMETHTAMEEGPPGSKLGLFALLDWKHNNEEEMKTQVDFFPSKKLLRKSSLSMPTPNRERPPSINITLAPAQEGQLKKAMNSYITYTESHLSGEEKVLQGFVKKTGSCEQETCDLIHHFLVGPVIDDIGSNEFAWFTSWCARTLLQHRGIDLAREFVVAMQRCTTSKEWVRILARLQQDLRPEDFYAMDNAAPMGLEADGGAVELELTRWEKPPSLAVTPAKTPSKSARTPRSPSVGTPHSNTEFLTPPSTPQ